MSRRVQSAVKDDGVGDEGSKAAAHFSPAKRSSSSATWRSWLALESRKASGEPGKRMAAGEHRRRHMRFAPLCTIVGIVLVVVLFCGLKVQSFLYAKPSSIVPTPQIFYITIPTTNPRHNVDVCRSLLTSQILHYPVPRLLPLAHDTPKDWLEALQQWLSTLPVAANTGLAMVAPGPQTFFQLRPDVLIQRVLDYNAKASQQLRSSHGSHIRQKVILSSSTGCARQHHTWHLPRHAKRSESTDPASPQPSKYNPFIIGRPEDIRLVVEAALQKMLSASSYDSVGAVMDSLVAEQEAARNSGSTSKDHIDLGLHYDHTCQLSLIASPGMESRVSWNVPHVPADIGQSMAPFWTPEGNEDGLPRHRTWQNVSLLHYSETSVVPPVIYIPNRVTTTGHEDAQRQPLSQDWWRKLWMQPYAEVLYDASRGVPNAIIADVVDGEGKMHRFWDRTPLSDRGGAIQGTTFLSWEKLCGRRGMRRELFGGR